MSEAVKIPDFNSSIAEHARKNFPLLDARMRVAEALDRIRRESIGERVIYFFATDFEGRLACGIVVGRVVFIWRQDAKGAAVIATSIAVSLVTACLFGFSVPSLLHSLKLDPKIAAGPVTRAVTDSCALAFYFSLAWLVLG